MAFGPETNAANSNKAGNKDFEPAVGFLNFYLPSADGGKVRLSKNGLPLVASSKREGALDAALRDPAQKEAVIAALMEHLIIEYVPADQPQSEGKAFKLGNLTF